MGRVIVVSNRVSDPQKAAQAGGVAVAIADCLTRRDGIWFGWSGEISDAVDSDATDQAPGVDRTGALARAVLPLTSVEYRDYYLGYSNSVLWPVFHNRVDLAQFEAGFFDVYTAVNRKFAAGLKSLLAADDVIWVHDYHFITLAHELRQLGVGNRIGFFLHIPFPPSQSFMAIPEHRKLAQAFASYDLIGLQSTTDVAHMIDYLEHGAHGHFLPDGRMRVDGREFSIASFPVGIDAASFNENAVPAGDQAAGALSRIVGVDRLDYTKGLPQKFRAYGRFLERYPEFRNRVVLTQIAAPTRESLEAYADIRKELETLTGAINGTFGDLEWVPIHYINRTVSRNRLAAIYRQSAVGLVTPLRDGMNLVAKEYVAAQDRQDPGVLILSCFAGAAEQLSEALIVNPYNIEEIADTIRVAVEMPLEERRQRHSSLMKKITAVDASEWCDAFLAQLSPAVDKSVALRRSNRRLRHVVKALSESAGIVRAPSANAGSAFDRPSNFSGC